VSITQISWKVYQYSYEYLKYLVISKTLKASKLWDWYGTPSQDTISLEVTFITLILPTGKREF